MITIAWILALPLAQAGELEAWQRTSFSGDDDGFLAGSDDWRNGYADDPWWGGDEVAASMSDDSIQDSSGEGYGSGWAADNWLIRGDSIENGHLQAPFYNEDNDTVGLVFRHNGHNSFYLLAHTADDAPPPLNSQEEPVVFLMRVVDGSAEILAQSSAELPRDDWSVFDVWFSGAELTVALNDRELFQVSDDQLLAAGQCGFYAYNSGYETYGPKSNTYFDSITLWWLDSDDDGVADDHDNCLHTANPEQQDEDGNGLGDACDEFIGPGDTGEPAVYIDGEDLALLGQCGCALPAGARIAATPGALMVFGLPLLTLFGLRRRRR